MRRFVLILAFALLLAAPARAAESPIVRFDTVLGDIDVKLFPGAAPATVANFLRYAARGSYADTYFHRSVLNFIVQGGGFRWPAKRSLIIDEFTGDTDRRILRNDRGTLAAARIAGEPARSTAQWFFNQRDNGSLDRSRDNYTVFGEVADDAGLGVVDRIGEQYITDSSDGNPGSAFSELPVLASFDGFLDRADLVLVNSITVPAPVWPPYSMPFLLVPSQVTLTKSHKRLRVTVRGLPANTYVAAHRGPRQGAAVSANGRARLSLRRSGARQVEVIALPPGVRPSRVTLRP